MSSVRFVVVEVQLFNMSSSCVILGAAFQAQPQLKSSRLALTEINKSQIFRCLLPLTTQQFLIVPATVLTHFYPKTGKSFKSKEILTDFFGSCVWLKMPDDDDGSNSSSQQSEVDGCFFCWVWEELGKNELDKEKKKT